MPPLNRQTREHTIARSRSAEAARATKGSSGWARTLLRQSAARQCTRTALTHAAPHSSER